MASRVRMLKEGRMRARREREEACRLGNETAF